jgi:hypothetical protein
MIKQLSNDIKKLMDERDSLKGKVNDENRRILTVIIKALERK